MGPTISISKESNENILKTNISPIKPQHNHKKETVFLLDWDDTLMCTTFVLNIDRPLSEEEQKIVTNLGKKVSKFLGECKKYGKIIIMTNSNEDWMKKTALDYLKLRPEIFKDVKIISTRDKYLEKGIEKKKWKEIALEELFMKYDEKIENLICASDSERDIEVFKNLAKSKKGINISTIKFKRKPSPIIMIRQIKFLNKNLSGIIGSNKNYYLIKEKQQHENDEFQFSFGSLLDYIFPN